MSGFICPIEDAIITSDYGMRLHPKTRKYEKHPALDLQNTSRTKAPVYSSYKGIVTKVMKDHISYGNYITITHEINGRAYVSLYAHLDSISVVLKQEVETGHKIGVMGKTGTATGIHLHFEIHDKLYSYDGGKYLNSLDPKGFIDIKKSISSIIEKKEPVKVDKPVNDKPVKTPTPDEEAWTWAVQEQLIRDGNPSNPVTRKQLAIVLHRFYKLIEKGRK